MFRLFFLSLTVLFSVDTATAQTYIFRHRDKKLESVISVGQRVKVFARDTSGHVAKYTGRLESIRGGYLFIEKKYKSLRFEMADIEEIGYHSTFTEKLLRFCLLAGLGLVGLALLGASILFIPAMASEGPSRVLNTMPIIGGLGAVLLVMYLGVNIFSRQWIGEPSSKWAVEIVQTNGGNRP